VLSKDVVQSLMRWMPRDPMGQLIRARLDVLEAVDDRTFRFRLNSPFPKMIFALGKNNTLMSFIMPERIARTDPFQHITEIVGSGPMRFKRDEWVPGSRAVFERFDGYVPCEEAPDWLSGGKRMLVDRIEWHILPDAATAAAALRSGEVDWWETALPDLIPVLRRNRNIQVDIADPLGNIGSFRLNHLHPPFNDVRARRAIQMALNQEDDMRAIVGSDDSLWKRLPFFFTPGMPAYTEAGGEILKGPRSIEGAKRLLAAAGHNGQPITVLVAQDQAPLKAMGEVTNALLRSLGMNVDFVATDWGTVVQRRASRHRRARADGTSSTPGMGAPTASRPPPTTRSAATAAAPGSAGRPARRPKRRWRSGWRRQHPLRRRPPTRRSYEEINRAAMTDVIYIPTGFDLGYQAWRRDVTGIQKGPLPFFWGVAKMGCGEELSRNRRKGGSHAA
jgi:peptide/nickel transport system substrate-binding protein